MTRDVSSTDERSAGAVLVWFPRSIGEYLGLAEVESGSSRSRELRRPLLEPADVALQHDGPETEFAGEIRGADAGPAVDEPSGTTSSGDRNGRRLLTVFRKPGHDDFFLLVLIARGDDVGDRPSATSTIGLLVDELDAALTHALTAGGTELVAPHNPEGVPRRSAC